MSDEAGILQTIRDVCAYIINLVATPLRIFAIAVIIVGALLDLVIFPGHYYGTILLWIVIGCILSYTLGMLTLFSFREWRKEQRRHGR